MLRLECLEEESKEVAADRDAAREEAALARGEASACRQEAAAARSEAAQARLAAAAARARADAAEQLPPVALLVRGDRRSAASFACRCAITCRSGSFTLRIPAYEKLATWMP